ncbi:MAG TPA: hypothetical protein DDW42_08135 [Desulfobacteraceae bacterium]|nr:hypothetical protein [Desulfobacteraceae bacterium]
MKRAVRIILCILFLVTITSCIYPAIFLGRTADGRIVDADTGQPIEGVVVLGIYYNEYGTPGGIVRRFHDAQETVTDKSGDFVISGTDILIFKAGYEYIDFMPNTLREGRGRRMGVKWEGGKAIIPLKKLTWEKMKRRLGPPDPPAEAPFEKVKCYLRELNKERVQKGLKPRGTWGGVTYE